LRQKVNGVARETPLGGARAKQKNIYRRERKGKALMAKRIEPFSRMLRLIEESDGSSDNKMEEEMKMIKGWKLFTTLPLAGFIVMAMGFAGSAFAGPDLQVRVWVDARSVHQNANHTYNFTIKGQVKNVGNADYVSRNNQQVLFLHEAGKSHHITDWHFDRLNLGQVMNVHVPVQNHPAGEFVPAYELALSFDPDIYLDKNPANDDHNRRNNQATVSSRTLSAAFARVSRPITVRPVGVRPGVIRTAPPSIPKMRPAIGHKKVTFKKLIGNRLYEIKKNGTRGYAPDGVYDIGKGMLKVRGGRVIMNTVSPAKLKELKERGMAVAPMG